MAKIIIELTKSWANKSTINHIYIDGKKAGVISSGTTVEYETTPGSHTVVVKSECGGKSKTIEVELGSDECRTVKLSAVKYNTWSRIVIPIILATIILVISEIINMKTSNIVLSLLVVYLISYFTIGKDKYWKLRNG